MKNENKTSRLLILQGSVIIFTISSIFAKLASKYTFLSFDYIMFYGLDLLFLGIYAIAWQQVIKKVDISIAYLNKATYIFWSMLFASIIFKEAITITNIIGVILIFVGILLVNRND